ncbi:DNA helicase exodeoxyribonuclease V, subunit B [Ligilactobacillus ruminis]|nr:DNA helicase exodeoxyribonuclease V, subunit B [Ligilactobacillus ruminis]
MRKKGKRVSYSGFYLTDEECKEKLQKMLETSGKSFYLTDEECKVVDGI